MRVCALQSCPTGTDVAGRGSTVMSLNEREEKTMGEYP